MAKFKIQIEELSHDDLVNLFSTATYDNYSNMQIVLGNLAKVNEKVSKQVTIEDKLATALEEGLRVVVMDYCGAEEQDPEFYGEEGFNYTSKFLDVDEGYRGALYIPCYEISMETLLNGMNDQKASRYIQEMFVDETGDLYSAWNLMQIAVFGEVIYG